MNDNFNEDSLCLAELQYKVIHHNTFDFKEGEKVFLKSNPEFPLIVDLVCKNVVFCKSIDNTVFYIRPECILQYYYSGLLIYKNRFDICLN